uniref:Uncharacterized protein n=1 Tax=Sphaerodactylus townsendi TaxID=933632 RepID=A0ACB8G7E3_9SAUR
MGRVVGAAVRTDLHPFVISTTEKATLCSVTCLFWSGCFLSIGYLCFQSVIIEVIKNASNGSQGLSIMKSGFSQYSERRSCRQPRGHYTLSHKKMLVDDIFLRHRTQHAESSLL